MLCEGKTMGDNVLILVSAVPADDLTLLGAGTSACTVVKKLGTGTWNFKHDRLTTYFCVYNSPVVVVR